MGNAAPAVAARLSLGVEEEFHLVDLRTRQLTPRAPEVLAECSEQQVVAELQRTVVETNSAVVTSLDDLRRELVAERRGLDSRAQELGAGIVAAGCVPLVDVTDLGVTDNARYARMLTDYQHLVREQLICGAQVHVGIPDRDLAVAVAGRVSADLPVLLALSASSPYWLGEDTGYASYRTFVWSRWPTAGPFPSVRNARQYDELVRNLIDTGVISDVGMVYFDVRPSAHVATLELRLCDACPRVDDVVLVAALFRALVLRAQSEIALDRPAVAVPLPLVRAATWRAARSGLEGDLVDLQDHRPRPVRAVVHRLLQTLRPQLEDTGDWDAVRMLAEETLRGGSSAARQRAAYRRRAHLTDVVDLLLAQTTSRDAGASGPSLSTVAADRRPVLDRYPLSPGDEGIGRDGAPLPAMQPIIAALERIGRDALRQRERDRDRHQTEREVTFVVEGETRPFPIDLVPRILPRDQWERLSGGLRQRALALEAFLRDVYGEGTCVAAGVVPRALLEASPGLRPSGTLVPPGTVRAMVIGVDLVRGPDGRWLVLEDNLRVPSGLAYAVHARDLLATVVPELTPPPGTADVSRAFDVLRAALRSGLTYRPDARVALLTSGESDPAWWEHTTIAARTGADLVQPKDLFVTDGGVHRVETGRRFRIDVIYRRLDEDVLDHVPCADGRPLGRRLLSAVRNGQVVLANAPGNGIADDKATYAYVPRLIEHFLGEAPLLDSVPTYLCADPAQRDLVLDRLGELVLKPVDGYGGADVVIGPASSATELDELRRQVRLAPPRWIAQEVVALSTHPTLTSGRLEPRHVDLRAFVVLRADGPTLADVHPEAVAAPLTRVGPRGSLVVNSSRGGGGKDTWIVP
ncbi:MAG: glutamate--cysteine ligase [Mycobacterium leprae]